MTVPMIAVCLVVIRKDRQPFMSNDFFSLIGFTRTSTFDEKESAANLALYGFSQNELQSFAALRQRPTRSLPLADPKVEFLHRLNLCL